MKRFVFFVLALAVAGAGAARFSPAHAATPEEMLQGATALDKAFLDAMNKGDAAAVAACYWNSPDVVNFPPDVLQARGHDAIEKGMVGMFTATPGLKLELTESHQIPAGDVVIGWGLFRCTLPGMGGEEMTLEGRFTDVKAIRDGKWVYILDHASVPMPPMEKKMPAPGDK